MKRSLTLAFAIVLAACKQPEPVNYSGMMLAPPKGKPDFTFTTTSGTPYDFRRETEGKLTLLFFGYSYCPDVCPMHMANVSAVLKKLDYTDRQRVRLVFVTTDPQRDTPERLHSWLAQIDSNIVGVAGPMEQINGLQQSLGLSPAKPEPTPGGPKGAYGIAHAAVVLAFTPDDSLRVVYPFGVRQQDWARDIPLLLRIKGGG
jgi:protein SCO1